MTYAAAPVACDGFSRGVGTACWRCRRPLKEHSHMLVHRWSTAGPFLLAPEQRVPIHPSVLEGMAQGTTYLDWDKYE